MHVPQKIHYLSLITDWQTYCSYLRVYHYLYHMSFILGSKPNWHHVNPSPQPLRINYPLQTKMNLNHLYSSRRARFGSLFDSSLTAFFTQYMWWAVWHQDIQRAFQWAKSMTHFQNLNLSRGFFVSPKPNYCYQI